MRKVPSAPLGGASGDPGLNAAHEILAAAGARGAPVAAVKVGTTVATNALLTRGGEAVLLITTQGASPMRCASAIRTGRTSSARVSRCRSPCTPP